MVGAMQPGETFGKRQMFSPAALPVGAYRARAQIINGNILDKCYGAFHLLKIRDKPSPEPVEGKGGYDFDKWLLSLPKGSASA